MHIFVKFWELHFKVNVQIALHYVLSHVVRGHCFNITVGWQQEAHLPCKKYCATNSQKLLLGTCLTQIQYIWKNGLVKNTWMCVFMLAGVTANVSSRTVVLHHRQMSSIAICCRSNCWSSYTSCTSLTAVCCQSKLHNYFYSQYLFHYTSFFIFLNFLIDSLFLIFQCFDAVGWVTGRASCSL